MSRCNELVDSVGGLLGASIANQRNAWRICMSCAVYISWAAKIERTKGVRKRRKQSSRHTKKSAVNIKLVSQKKDKNGLCASETRAYMSI